MDALPACSATLAAALSVAIVEVTSLSATGLPTITMASGLGGAAVRPAPGARGVVGTGSILNLRINLSVVMDRSAPLDTVGFTLDTTVLS